MKEDIGNLWTYPADAIVISTNGYVNKNGKAVMGRGCAREAVQRWPFFPMILGEAIKKRGNIVFVWGLQIVNDQNEMVDLLNIITMPVKNNWWELADLNLIEKSAKDLKAEVDMWHFDQVVMPQVGCGNGGLDWKDVKPILEEILDDRFTAITF